MLQTVFRSWYQTILYLMSLFSKRVVLAQNVVVAQEIVADNVPNVKGALCRRKKNSSK